MSVRKIGFDRATLDGKVILDDDQFLVMPAVIARAIVHDYPQGRAYKPADELEKAAWTAEGRWVTTLHHPETGLIMRSGDIKGRVEASRFAKDILDKTKRPKTRGIRANIKWFKDRVPSALIDDIKSGAMRDVSIGFTYDEDRTPGEFEGDAYDFVQRNIFIDHVAAPVQVGRCPTPFCGIGVDAIMSQGGEGKTTIIAGDPWDETEEYIRSGHKEPSDTCRTKVLSEDEGIKAIVCQYGEEWEIQSYLFSKEKGWTMEKAKAWFEEHKGDAVPDDTPLPEKCYCRECDYVLENPEKHCDEIKCPECGAERLYRRKSPTGDDMKPEEIQAKIEELREQREALRDKLDERYKTMKPEPEDPEITKLYEQLEDLEAEIRAYQELKVKRIVEGEADCAICKEIDNLGKLAFAKRMVAVWGEDALKVLMEAEPPKEPPKPAPIAEDVVALIQRSEELIAAALKLREKAADF